RRYATESFQLQSSSDFGNGLRVEGEVQERAPARGFVWFRAVAGGYTEAMGMRLLRGRSLEQSEIDRGEPNIVVNQAFANTYFPGRDPIGQTGHSKPDTRSSRFH